MTPIQIFLCICITLLFFGTVTLFLDNCEEYTYKTYDQGKYDDHACTCEKNCECRCDPILEKIKIEGGVKQKKLTAKKFGFV